MSRSKEKHKEKSNFFGSDEVGTPEEIINADKDNNRKEAFRVAYNKIKKIVPNYFITMNKRKAKPNSSGGFAQEIVVTSENAKIETKTKENTKEKEDYEREREY